MKKPDNMSTKDENKKDNKSNIKSYLGVFGAVMTLLVLGATIYSTFVVSESMTLRYKYKQLEEIKNQYEIMNNKLVNEINKLQETNTKQNNIITKPLKDGVDTGVSQQINKIGKRVNEIDSSIVALRQAINPYRPEEALTIVRVKDEVIMLKNRIDQLYDILKREQDNFRNSVAREMDATSKSVYLILIVLIPLVFNFLYTTVWKDFREGKKEKENKDKSDEKI